MERRRAGRWEKAWYWERPKRRMWAHRLTLRERRTQRCASECSKRMPHWPRCAIARAQCRGRRLSVLYMRAKASSRPNRRTDYSSLHPGKETAGRLHGLDAVIFSRTLRAVPKADPRSARKIAILRALARADSPGLARKIGAHRCLARAMATARGGSQTSALEERTRGREGATEPGLSCGACGEGREVAGEERGRGGETGGMAGCFRGEKAQAGGRR